MLTLEQAQAAGLRRFFTGQPCRNGHAAERYVAGGACVQCAAVRMAKASKKWKDAHRELMRQASKSWRGSNADKVRATNAAWAAANPTLKAEMHRAWREANPEYHRRYSAARRQKQSEDQLSRGIVERLWQLQAGRCACPCRQHLLRNDFHIDHIVALSRGGRNIDSNVQLLTPECNLKKYNKDNSEFFVEQAARFGGRHAHT
jgi:5-methylcytosine-specific restriction endonuclease McrA